MGIIGNPVQRSTSFLKRESFHKERWDAYQVILNTVKLGGGAKAIEKHKAKGKLTARERIHGLLDTDSEFFEIGSLAAYDMYREHGPAPSAGTIVGVGRISGIDTVIVANDSTVKAGAWFPMTCKKNLRAQEIAMENHIPIVYLVDSAGVFLPLQDEIFPDKEHFGRIFRNNARMSSMGIPQISAIMGPCVAGGAYLPIMSDEAIIVENEGFVFLAGSHLVKAAIGEQISNEDLGGARVQSNISGVTDYIAKNDQDCLMLIRQLMSKISLSAVSPFRRQTPELPAFSPEEILGILPEDPIKPYPMNEVIARIVDRSEIDEYKAGYGKSLITAYAFIDGWPVGIIANQREVVRTEKGEMQVGGVIYSDSADKAARFIMNCNQRNIPLVFLQDVTGFMVGSRAEQGGIIKDGAKMVNAVANSVVPKITIILGNSFGAGNYAMCGKAYDPRFIFTLPHAKIAVMGGQQAANVLLEIQIQQAAKKGKIISDEEKQTILTDIIRNYEEKNDPLYAAARLWIDEIIHPARMRDYISMSIRVASNKSGSEKFNVGLIQT